MVFKIVFLRHGESVWNVENIFTGWADVDLSPTGELEAIEAGKCLKEKGFKFDLVFTSVLRRAIKTAWKACMESENFTMPVINTWRLNERHYGGLQGKNKAQTAAEHGDAQVKIWRRSYDVPPPEIDQSHPMHPATDPLYGGVPKSALPGAESLKLTVDRVLPFWHDHIAPCVMAGKSVLVAAHGNSLRALCKYIENMSEGEVLDLNIPTGVPLVYELDDDLKFVKKYYLMDPEEVAAKMAAVANQGKSGGGSSTTAYPALGAAVSKLLEHPKIQPLDGPLADLGSGDDVECVKSLNMAFLKALTGNAESEKYLETAKSGKFSEVGAYYCTAIDRIKKEISAAAGSDAGLESALKEAAAGDAGGSIAGAESFWKIFFPAGVNMLSRKDACIQELRDRRKVKIETLNPNPIKDPVKEMLFTSNVLLGLPPDSKPISSLNYSDDFKAKLEATSQEKQIAWFDHPIQIGVDPEGNEILYGLKGLDVAVGWEKEKGNIPNEAEMLTLLSITCTHAGLQAIGKQYVEEEFKALPETDKIKHLKIMLFSEIETDALVDTVLKPACAKIGFSDMDAMREIFGVEGQYGRHYSFLKAILAVYHCFIDSAVRATFKIDIDQLFIQDSIVAENDGMSMLDHFKTDRWGAIGKNWKGEEIELGMIAGALCNQKDWEANDKKLFIPDVLIPKEDKQLAADELVFFSGLPQAISTEAEMMWKYKSNDDVIQRIHVTGGTNGILVDTLFKHKPFAPSWIGRAEDQSYIFSTLGKPGTKMGYVHQPGLIMRHDKEAFAMEAMEAARIGKMVGDYERILLFSEYSKVAGNLATVKELVDPFTGGFCVPIPYTTTFIRFALKALGFAAGGATKDMVDFTVVGAPRVAKVIDFTKSDSGASELEKSFKKETASWDKFYKGLEAAKGDAAIADAAKAVFEKATCAL